MGHCASASQRHEFDELFAEQGSKALINQERYVKG